MVIVIPKCSFRSNLVRMTENEDRQNVPVNIRYTRGFSFLRLQLPTSNEFSDLRRPQRSRSQGFLTGLSNRLPSFSITGPVYDDSSLPPTDNASKRFSFANFRKISLAVSRNMYCSNTSLTKTLIFCCLTPNIE